MRAPGESPVVIGGSSYRTSLPLCYGTRRHGGRLPPSARGLRGDRARHLGRESRPPRAESRPLHARAEARAAVLDVLLELLVVVEGLAAVVATDEGVDLLRVEARVVAAVLIVAAVALTAGAQGAAALLRTVLLALLERGLAAVD